MYNFKCYLRYVNEIFILIEQNFDLSHLISLTNSINSSIQFTYEAECSNTFPFPNILVSEVTPVFSTSVFRKDDSNYILLHVKSSHPWQKQILAFYSYVYRAVKLCSDSMSLRLEIVS